MKVTQKTGENKIQQKVKQVDIKGKTNSNMNITNEGDVQEILNEAVNSWQTQGNLTSDSGIPNRVLDLLSTTQPVSNIVNNNNVANSINPFIPVVHVKHLPSKFTPYKLLVTNPEISYKPYKFGEIKKMSQSKMTVRQLFEEVLSGIECNFNKELLTLSDFKYLGLLRRLQTLRSAKFNANFECDVCGFHNKQVFDHTVLDFKDLECDLPAQIDIDGKEYIFTPITVRDYLLLYDLDKLDDQIAFFSVQCRNTDIEINYSDVDENGVRLTEEQRRFYTIYDIFYNLTSIEDGEVLELLDDYLDHTLKPVELKCRGEIESINQDGVVTKNKCENPINVTLDGGGVLITPFRESTESLTSRIRFGSKTNS